MQKVRGDVSGLDHLPKASNIFVESNFAFYTESEMGTKHLIPVKNVQLNTEIFEAQASVEVTLTYVNDF